MLREEQRDTCPSGSHTGLDGGRPVGGVDRQETTADLPASGGLRTSSSPDAGTRVSPSHNSRRSERGVCDARSPSLIRNAQAAGSCTCECRQTYLLGVRSRFLFSRARRSGVPPSVSTVERKGGGSCDVTSRIAHRTIPALAASRRCSTEHVTGVLRSAYVR
jgi:hypothetical protein